MITLRSRIVLLACLMLLGCPPARAAAPTLATLPIPGSPDFVAVARDVIGVTFAMDPSQASGAGLFEDCVAVPSYSLKNMRAINGRIDRDIAALSKMPWRTWDVDKQIDFRWIYANAELAQRQLVAERIYVHRCGAWLEPTANNLINLVTYVPDRLDLQTMIIEKIPDMVDEMREMVVAPTHQDVVVGEGLIDGLLAMFKVDLAGDPIAVARLHQAREAAARSLKAYRDTLASLKNLRNYEVIGANNYAWRFSREELLPWTPDQLVALAKDELARVDRDMAALKNRVEKPAAPTPAQKEEARSLTRDSMLAMYDAIEVANRAALEKSGIITIPPGVGPIKARETPEAMVPLTGDGGSMNPPPAIGTANVSYWNVEHFHSTWSPKVRLQTVVGAENFRTTEMGPYAAHEGVPGHHLQLSIARLLPDPIRSILQDGVENEGWALYMEDAFWQAGGLGPSVAAHYNTLDSWRYRIRRVMYDVNVETGKWTLQQGADYKDEVPPGKGKIDGDITRTFNWPTQLICYFAGKMQILQLKADYKKKVGAAFSERDFNDRLLQVGSVPIVFARAKLLGEPVPDIQPPPSGAALPSDPKD